MHPSRLLLVPAAALALAACSPRPPDANPDSAGRTAAPAVRGETPTRPGPAMGAGAQRDAGGSRSGLVSSGPEGPGDARAAPGASASAARDPASTMGGPAARTAASAPGPSAAARLDDAQLTARVKAELAAARDLAGAPIDVDAREGVVTLSGAVRSAAIKARASEIARSVRGVNEVNDQLTLATS